MKKVIYILLILSASMVAQVSSDNYIWQTTCNTKIQTSPANYNKSSIGSGTSHLLALSNLVSENKYNYKN